MYILDQNMVLKMLNCFGDGKNLNVRWPTSETTGGFHLDVSTKMLYQSASG